VLMSASVSFLVRLNDSGLVEVCRITRSASLAILRSLARSCGKS
jgi:hypothetical protein